MSDTLAARLEFAERIAVEAGRSTLELFHASERQAETKADGSPVTAADRAAETLLRARIGESYPHDAILGEEFDDKPGSTGWRWILDPIDGTKSFVHGVPLYGTMVACEFEGTPRVGVIHMPGLGETVAGSIDDRGLRAGWWTPAGRSERRPLAVSSTPTPDRALALWTCPEVYRDLGVLHVFQHLERVLGHQRGWSDCYAYVLLTTGRADAVVEAGLKVWDIAAALPILHAAGARVSDWTGGEDFGGGSVLATNGPVHEALLHEIRQALDAE